MNKRHFEILKEMINDFNEYSTDYTKTRCRELEQVLIDTLDYITNLQEENEKLKELCDKYEEEHSTTFNEWKETITDKCQTLKDLQEEVEDLRRIFGIWNNRKLINKFNKEYDKEDKNKNPNRNYVAIYPDAEEVYKRYYDYKSRNEKAKSLTNRTIEIIKQQPSGNDEWILERLNGINYCLGGDEE